MAKDKIGWHSTWTLHKWQDPDGRIAKFVTDPSKDEEAERIFNQKPIVETWHDNCALQVGLTELMDLLIASGGTGYAQANAYLGVGDSATAATSAQTGLLGTTNSAWTACTAVTRVAGEALTWRGVFAAGEGSFGWEEYTIATASNETGGTGVCLNRKCESKGTKAAGESWTLDLTISFS